MPDYKTTLLDYIKFKIEKLERKKLRPKYVVVSRGDFEEIRDTLSPMAKFFNVDTRVSYELFGVSLIVSDADHDPIVGV